MQFDDLFLHFGEIGRYQVMLTVMLMIPMMFADTICLNFTTGRMDHWCYVPQLDHLNASEQKRISIPYDEDGKYAKCSMFDLDYVSFNQSDFSVWDHAVNTTNVVDCQHGWVYDRSLFTETIVSSVSHYYSNRTRFFSFIYERRKSKLQNMTII